MFVYYIDVALSLSLSLLSLPSCFPPSFPPFFTVSLKAMKKVSFGEDLKKKKRTNPNSRDPNIGVRETKKSREGGHKEGFLL